MSGEDAAGELCGMSGRGAARELSGKEGTGGKVGPEGKNGADPLGAFASYHNGKLLRAGITTGTCAAAAAKAAVFMMLSGEKLPEVRVTIPAGISLCLVPEEIRIEKDVSASCGIRKDAGDDPDATDGILIRARAEAESLRPGEGASEIRIFGGKGIGRVTKPGLDQPVGEAAINSVPRQMIREGAEEALRENGMHGKIRVTISADRGEEIAQKTFNPRLGITGGISILGTEGVVRPMSSRALIETIRADVRVHAQGGGPVLAVPGNYGVHFLEDRYGVPREVPVLMSNFIGETIDAAADCGASSLVLAGHIGKFVKLAGGIMNTHSREADARMEILAAHALRCGADRETCLKILDAAVTEEAVALLREKGLLQDVSRSLLSAMERAAEHRAAGRIRTAVLFYTQEDGTLAAGEHAVEWIDQARELSQRGKI